MYLFREGLFCLFLLSACGPVEKIGVVKPHCLASQSRCLIKTKVGSFSVLFDVKKIHGDIPFSIRIHYQGTNELKTLSGYMEGKTMFMGKIPLSFKKQNIKNDLYVANSMVVACTSPVMTWRIWISSQLYDQNQQKNITQGFFVDFDSFE